MDLAQNSQTFYQGINQANIVSSNEYPLIPDEAFLYFPTKEEQLKGEGQAGIRRIFDGKIQFNGFEHGQLSLLEDKLNGQNKVALNEWWDKAKILRFLYANKFNIFKTIDSMDTHQKWRMEYLPPQPSPQAMELLTKGAMYLHGIDSRFRPIIVIDISKLRKDANVDLQTILLGMSTMLEYLLQNCMLNGQIENWIVILDLKNYGATQLPVKNIQGLMSYFQNNYRSRMYKCYIVNSTWTITGIWKMIKKVLNETTVSKVIFEKDKPVGLFEHAHSTQIEQQYGGQALNKTAPYWPPVAISNQYLMPQEEQNINNILISKEQYVDLLLTKQLNNSNICYENINNAVNVKIEYTYSNQPIVDEKTKDFKSQTNADHAVNLRKGNLQIKKIQKTEQQQQQQLSSTLHFQDKQLLISVDNYEQFYN